MNNHSDQKVFWRNENQTLIARIGSISRELSLSDIVSAYDISGKQYNNLPVENPDFFRKYVNELPEFGLDVKLKINLGDYINDGFLTISVCIESLSYEFSIIEYFNSKHRIINDKLYFFNLRDYQEIYSLFESLKINKSSGKINLNQYLHLLNEIPELVDDSDSSESLENAQLMYDPQLISQPESFRGSLFDYQKIGYKWLSQKTESGIGCLLADQMGLGKTIQTIALILKRKEEQQALPSLIVCKASLIDNWKDEITKFAANTISVHIQRGSQRIWDEEELSSFDVILSSYEQLLVTPRLYKSIEWDLVILDEAARITNPDAQITNLVKDLKRNSGIAITGTPFQNNIISIWSLMDFCIPGFLGEQFDFTENYRNDFESAEKLEKLISPIMLRRITKEVAKDLPEMRVEIVTLTMCEKESEIYENEKELLCKDDKLSLPAIIPLRKISAHHGLFSDNSSQLIPINDCSKYKYLIDLIESIFSTNEKLIIFTSFHKMVDILIQDLSLRFQESYINKIDGRTPQEERQFIINEFNESKKNGALILNPKAAGEGLNIQQANNIIHYNPEWNPSIEDQANARAHRIGQNKTVLVSKLVYRGSIEEYMLEKQDYKRTMSDIAIKGDDGTTKIKMKEMKEYLLKSKTN